MFCGCELSFNDPPNTHTCPVCLGLPGALPVVNARAIHYGIMIGLALGCEIAERSLFHRKNYFYPDLPKGYQISQYDVPLCRGGHLGDVRIHRVHLEEDAAKLNHLGASGRIHGVGPKLGRLQPRRHAAGRDRHRARPALARAGARWPTLLRTTLRQLGVSDVNMEEGSLRVDANVSVRPAGSTELGTKTELKNMNSFRSSNAGSRRRSSARSRCSNRASRSSRRRCTSTRRPTRSRRCAPRRRRTTTATSPSPTWCRSSSRGDARRGARRYARGASRRAGRAVRARARPERRHRPAVRVPDRARRLLRAGAAPPRTGHGDRATVDPVELSNWIPQLVERIGSDADPAASTSRPRASRRWRRWSRPRRSAAMPRARS